MDLLKFILKSLMMLPAFVVGEICRFFRDTLNDTKVRLGIRKVSPEEVVNVYLLATFGTGHDAKRAQKELSVMLKGQSLDSTQLMDYYKRSSEYFRSGYIDHVRMIVHFFPLHPILHTLLIAGLDDESVAIREKTVSIIRTIPAGPANFALASRVAMKKENHP